MSEKLKNLVKISPSIKESQILTDEEMSTLEGGCAIVCDTSCALGCLPGYFWGGKPTTPAPTTTTTTSEPF